MFVVLDDWTQDASNGLDLRDQFSGDNLLCSIKGMVVRWERIANNHFGPSYKRDAIFTFVYSQQ